MWRLSVLQLKALGVHNLLAFPLPDPPPRVRRHKDLVPANVTSPSWSMLLCMAFVCQRRGPASARTLAPVFSAATLTPLYLLGMAWELLGRVSLVRAMEMLLSLGALSAEGALTRPTGAAMAQLPLDPLYAKALLQAQQFGAVQEVLLLVAMLSVDAPSSSCPSDSPWRVRGQPSGETRAEDTRQWSSSPGRSARQWSSCPEEYQAVELIP